MKKHKKTLIMAIIVTTIFVAVFTIAWFLMVTLVRLIEKEDTAHAQAENASILSSSDLLE